MGMVRGAEFGPLQDGRMGESLGGLHYLYGSPSYRSSQQCSRCSLRTHVCC